MNVESPPEPARGVPEWKLGRCRCIGLIVIGFFLSGCLPLSVSPLGKTEDAFVFKKSLLGRWEVSAGENPTVFYLGGGRSAKTDGSVSRKLVGSWEVKQGEGKGYQLIATDSKGREARFGAHLVSVDERLFIDMQIKDSEANPWTLAATAPTHAFLRLKVRENAVAVSTLTLAGTESPS